MKFILQATLCFFPFLGFGQVNFQLKNEIDSMYILDQRYRGYFSRLSDNPALVDSLKNAFSITQDLTGYLWTVQSRIDSLNLNRIEQIIKQHGYPGTALVGKPTDEAAFYIIQHSSKIETYFPLVRAAAKDNQLPFYLSAMMEDRLLMQQSKPQIYGSQVGCYRLRANTSTSECFVWPIKNAQSVNERRLKAGFTQSVEDNSKRLGVEFKPLTIKEVQARYQIKN